MLAARKCIMADTELTPLSPRIIKREQTKAPDRKIIITIITIIAKWGQRPKALLENNETEDYVSTLL